MTIEIKKEIKGYHFCYESIINDAVNSSKDVIIKDAIAETYREPLTNQIITKIIIHIEVV